MKQHPGPFVPDFFDPRIGKPKYGENTFLWMVQTILFLVLLLSSDVSAGVPIPKNLFITDVSTVSFSVIWSTNEACTANLEVYSDANGSSMVPGVSIVPHPVLSGDSEIKTAAEDSGVMKVMVTGLQPDTAYYVKTISTSKSTAEIAGFPNASPYLSVTTQSEIIRNNGDQPFSNDVIIESCYKSDGSTPATGSLLMATISGVNYPITAFVGDGVALPFAIIDLNNAFSKETFGNIDLKNGEKLTLLNLRGTNGNSVVTYRVPEDEGLSEVKDGNPTLKPGANLVSFQLEPVDNLATFVLAPIEDRIEVVWGKNDQGNWISYRPGFPFNSLTQINSFEGYWFMMLEEASLKVDGSIRDGLIPLQPGANLVGFRSIETIETYETTDNILSNLEVIWGKDEEGNWVSFRPGFPFNSLREITPGTAYYVYVDDFCDW